MVYQARWLADWPAGSGEKRKRYVAPPGCEHVVLEVLVASRVQTSVEIVSPWPSSPRRLGSVFFTLSGAVIFVRCALCVD